MKARIALVALALCCPAVAYAGQVLIIDDFTDPSMIQFPGGPSEAAATGVGDLSAERLILLRRTSLSMPTVLRADVGVTRPGQYFVDMDEPGETSFVDLVYRFPRSDFSRHDAIRIDINPASFSTHPDTPPVLYLRVIAIEAQPEPFDDWLVRSFPGGLDTGRLILPLDSFTNRAGGPIDANWDAIGELRVTVGSASGWGQWELVLDQISLGPAIPEPSTAHLAAGCLGCFLCFKGRGKCLVESVLSWRSCRC